MKKALYLTGLAFFFTVALMAQANNAILFAENGEKFQVILNGILQNQTPETNVKMTELVADHYKCRIVFADTKLGFVDFNMFFNEMGSEITWNIKQNNKGQYVTRYVSAVPIAQAPQTPASQTVVVYTAVAPPVYVINTLPVNVPRKSDVLSSVAAKVKYLFAGVLLIIHSRAIRCKSKAVMEKVIAL